MSEWVGVYGLPLFWVTGPKGDHRLVLSDMSLRCIHDVMDIFPCSECEALAEEEGLTSAE